jgi:hypothetical protein
VHAVKSDPQNRRRVDTLPGRALFPSPWKRLKRLSEEGFRRGIAHA